MQSYEIPPPSKFLDKKLISINFYYVYTFHILLKIKHLQNFIQITQQSDFFMILHQKSKQPYRKTGTAANFHTRRIRYNSDFGPVRNDCPIAHIQSNWSTIHSQAFLAMRTTRKAPLTCPTRVVTGFRMNTRYIAAATRASKPPSVKVAKTNESIQIVNPATADTTNNTKAVPVATRNNDNDKINLPTDDWRLDISERARIV